MSNNLRQIAKDLRSFVKRCKDVHYSDSLLITFLVTGLLTTFAPSIIRADVAEDQQEVSAQAYDTITDLRQSFLRAKKENQKALRGANAELAQLLKEGDQVVKSPWASFQFGTGYTNNDWGTAYKGRGGKKLEYYSRTNDLTKYVFDASKHQYGATNLHISRNEEPNTLSINPANVHEPYSPYTVDQLSALSELAAPSFAPDLAAPGRVNYTPHFSLSVAAPSRSVDSNVSESAFTLNDPAYNNLNVNSVTYHTNALGTVSATDVNAYTGTTVTTGSKNNTTGQTASTKTNAIGTVTPTKHTFLTSDPSAAPYYGKVYNTRHWWRNGPEVVNAITSISGGTFNIGKDSTRSDNEEWKFNSGGTDPKAEVYYYNVVANTVNGGSSFWGEDGANAGGGTSASITVPNSAAYNAGTVAAIRERIAIEYLRHPSNRNKSWLDAKAYAASATIHHTTYIIGGGTTPNASTYSYSNTYGSGTFNNNTTTPGEPYYQTQNKATVDAVIYAPRGTFDISGTTFNLDGTTKRAAIVVGDGTNASTVNVTGSNTFYIAPTSVNAQHSIIAVNQAGILNVTGANNVFEINKAATKNNAIYNAGTASVNGATFRIYSKDSNGVENVANAHLTLTNGSYDLTGQNANIVTNAGTVETSGGTYNISGVESNGILSSGSLTVDGGNFTVSKKDSNIIVNTGAAHIKNGGKFVIHKSISGSGGANGIYNNVSGSKVLRVEGRQFDVDADTSNGINNVAGIVTVSGNTFNIAGNQSNGVTNAGQLRIEGANNRFTIAGGSSSGVYNTGKVTGTNVTFDIVQTNSPAGTQSNGIINDGTDLVSLTTGVFNVYQNESNGINNTKANGTIKLSGIDFTVGNTTGGIATGYKSNGVANLGTLSTSNGSFVINGQNANGILNETGGKVETKYTNFTINAVATKDANAISTDGKLEVYGGTITIGAPQSNGIITSSSATAVKIEGTDFVLNANKTNGINNPAGASTITVTRDLANAGKRSSFTGIAGIQNSNGIYTNSTGNTDISYSDFTFDYPTSGPGTGKYNNGILIGTGTGTTATHKIDRSTFKFGSAESNGIAIGSGASLDVTNSSFDLRGYHSNGIRIESAAAIPSVNVKNSSFNTEGSFSNGIYTTGKITNLKVTDNSTFVTSGNYSNGIYTNGAIDLLEVTGGSITTKGNYSNGVYAKITAGKPVNISGVSFNVASGTNSNGIYAKSGVVDLKNSSVTVEGTNSNGLLVESTTYGGVANDKSKIENVNFYVNTPASTTAPGAYNNGVFVGGGRTVDYIKNSNFVLNGNGANRDQNNNNIGILVGDSTGKGTITSVENTKFDIKSTSANTSTDKGGTGIYMYHGDVTLDKETTIRGDSNDVFVTIRNREHNNTLNLKSGGLFGTGTGFFATGDNNIGINIQDGDSNHSNHADLTIANSSGTDGWILNFVGKNNVGVKNDYFAKKLILKNEATAMPGGNGAGSMRIDGEKGIMFANLGYVHEGTLQLDGVSMVGKNSTIAAFLNNNYNKGTFDIHSANTGAFTNSSDGIKLRGAIGGVATSVLNSDGTRDSANSVGIYANTGQSAAIRSDVVARDVLTPTTGPLTINSLSIGLGKHATNSTVLWADRGTHISVENNTYTTNGGANHLSDGVMQNATVDFGYNVDDENTSENSVYAYATGYFSKGAHGYSTTAGPGADGSKITLKKQLDLVSRRGTALLTTDGGLIESKAVRAGGHDSILAYADTGTGGKASSITIEGNILAADNNLLGVNNRGTHAVNAADNGDISVTYRNIGAVALNGSSVTIKNAVRTTDVKENKTNTKVDQDISESLIYGMAAYAKGKDSIVTFDKTKAAAVTVVSGENGALYATDQGTIEFAGDIINQNNVGTSIPTVTSGQVTGVVAGSRNGRGTSATVGVDNDHTNTTPFYVNRGVNEGNYSGDGAGILFNSNLTNIDMYDGILFTGNVYGRNGLGDYQVNKTYEVISDYYYDDTNSGPGNAYSRAKYRGMKNVKAAIMKDNYAVNLGIINQPKGKLFWNSDGNTSTATDTDNYLGSIGQEYAGKMGLSNAARATKGSTTNGTQVGNLFKSTILNGDLTINKKGNNTVVNLENVELTKAGASDVNDPFNDISMESTLVTIDKGQKVIGDIGYYSNTHKYGAGQGLNMNNSLYRWEDVTGGTTGTSRWIKTQASSSGYINKGTIDVYGGTNQAAGIANIAGMNVVFGTAQNDTSGEIKVDHGYGIFATDSSYISNAGKITVTGKYIGENNTASTYRINKGFSASAETAPSGQNYGIVGISKGRANYATTSEDGKTTFNKITIDNINGKIKAEGDLAVGIYAENKGDALKSDIKVNYTDTGLTADDGIDVENTLASASNANARGVGIAIVNNNTGYTSANLNRVGGLLTLTAKDGVLGKHASKYRNILTGKGGVGIYAEGSDINLTTKSFTVEAADNGVGLWAVDQTNIALGQNTAHTRTFQFNYNGSKDKNGYAMAFSSRNTGITTTAQNDLDITFSNVGNNGSANVTTLNTEKTNTNTATSKGIAGILVNTHDINDVVVNRGHIKEDKDSSVTHVRSYGAVVNQGTFENWGDITLAESLLEDANKVARADMDKVNVGIRTNNLDRTKTKIVNHGDIKIGDTTSGSSNPTSAQNIGSWAIYGTNIETGKKSDGKNSQIVINRNSYGIYSGDGDVNIADTDIKVGNDTVLGHVQYHGKFSDGTPYSIDRQKDNNGNVRYSLDSELLSQLGRQRDSAIGVYIDNNQSLSNRNRNVTVNADMEIDRFSHGIVLAEKTGGATTTVNIGSAGKRPNIKLAYSTDNNAGGHVHSTKPTDTPEKIPHEVYEQGNAVYYYSADNTSRATTYANVTMDGDYNTAYFTKGSVINHGNIDLRSQYDVDKRATVDPTWEPVGYGSVGIISENTDKNFASINYGTITTGLSDTTNMMYSVGMGAGRNFYRTNNKNEVVYDRTEGQGYVVNEGVINVQEKAGIGMLATGRGSRAINKGTINLIGDNSIGMYIDREAVGENYGTIKGNAQNLKGVIAINGGFIKNYGTIDILGTGSTGIMTDSSKFVTDANGKPVFDANGNPTYITDETRPEYATAITAGQANGKTAANRGANDGTGTNDFYGTHNTDGVTTAVGSETSIEEGTSGNPKTTGVGTTIKMPNVVPLTQVTIDGVLTPITNIDTDARNIGDYANNITLRNSIQTGGTRIIDLSTRDEFGNRAWPRYRTNQTSEVTTIGMYVDTSGVRYTNPYNGIQNLTSLGRVNLYFGTEATMYTNAKAIRFGDIVHDDGTIEQSNILKPFNDALRLLPGGSVVNPLSAGLTWQTAAKINDNNQVTEVVMSKVPYHSFAFDSDKSLVNFTNNLDNLYEIARPGSEEKMIFNRLNSLGNGEGHILAQAFDQMRGHIYGGIQQRTNATSNLLTDELAQLRSENNASKDSNKIKAFGRREEYKTDTAGLPDWNSNAGGFVYLHEDETVKLGDRSGWYAGAVNNYFTFKDLARSYENQAMLKTGIFKQTPLDEDGTFTFTIGGDAFFGKTNTKRRFWVVDKEFRAKSDYYTYGADINAKLEKEFRLTEGFSIVPNVGLDLQYGRFSTVNEDGDMALKIKSDDYYSVKPRAGVDFRYSQPVFKKSNFVASVGLSYETELGRLNDVENEAKIKGAWTDYYTIKGDKEDRKGNFKSDLKLGLDNGRLGFTVNTGYDTKGHNFRAGLGLRALF